MDRVIQFNFGGDHKPVGLHVRRAVAEFLSEPEKHYTSPDLILSLSGETWAKVYLSAASVEDLVKKGDIEVQRGNIAEVAQIFDLFDKYRPEKAVLIRPHLHD